MCTTTTKATISNSLRQELQPKNCRDPGAVLFVAIFLKSYSKSPCIKMLKMLCINCCSLFFVILHRLWQQSLEEMIFFFLVGIVLTSSPPSLVSSALEVLCGGVGLKVLLGCPWAVCPATSSEMSKHVLHCASCCCSCDACYSSIFFVACIWYIGYLPPTLFQMFCRRVFNVLCACARAVILSTVCHQR